MRYPRIAPVLLLALMSACGGDGAEGSAGGGSDAATAHDPAPARMVDGKPEGLFFMTRFWAFTNSLEKVVWYFAPDGRVYQNLETGFSPEDLAAHKGNRGTYEMVGDVLKVTWSDGKVTQATIQAQENAFGWDAGIFTAVKPFAEGKSVAGSYEGGESISTGAGMAASSTGLELRPDGTFSSAGVTSVQSETSESQVSAGGQGGSTGTWKVAGYSLLMTYADGTTVRSIAFPYDDPETPVYPDRLFVGGTMFKRK